MGNVFTKAKEGYKFIPTAKADARVLAKFQGDEKGIVKQYKHSVPITWVEKGLVAEVEDE